MFGAQPMAHKFNVWNFYGWEAWSGRAVFQPFFFPLKRHYRNSKYVIPFIADCRARTFAQKNGIILVRLAGTFEKPRWKHDEFDCGVTNEHANGNFVDFRRCDATNDSNTNAHDNWIPFLVYTSFRWEWDGTGRKTLILTLVAFQQVRRMCWMISSVVRAQLFTIIALINWHWHHTSTHFAIIVIENQLFHHVVYNSHLWFAFMYRPQMKLFNLMQ